MNVVDVATRHGWSTGALLAEGSFQDPENARIIYIAAAGLLLLALGLAVGTWWWWRSAKVEHPALGPLEVMGSRTWRKGDFNNRVKYIENARPANAIHEPDLAEPDELDVEAIDLTAMGRAEPAMFDDFSDLIPGEPAAAEVAAVAASVDTADTADASDTEIAEEPAEPVPDESPESVDSESDASEPAVEATSDENAPEPDPAPEPVVGSADSGDAVALQFAFDDPGPDVATESIDPLLRLNTGE